MEKLSTLRKLFIWCWYLEEIFFEFSRKKIEENNFIFDKINKTALLSKNSRKKLKNVLAIYY